MAPCFLFDADVKPVCIQSGEGFCWPARKETDGVAKAASRLTDTAGRSTSGATMQLRLESVSLQKTHQLDRRVLKKIDKKILLELQGIQADGGAHGGAQVERAQIDTLG
ncbi:MAG TPA: hypothetical protein PKZ39_00870, partial [Clostridia bacterium]|nr:hypothetical protein [Clostridia bacterium]